MPKSYYGSSLAGETKLSSRPATIASARTRGWRKPYPADAMRISCLFNDNLLTKCLEMFSFAGRVAQESAEIMRLPPDWSKD